MRPGLRRRWEGSLPGQGARHMRDLELGTHALALCAQQVLCAAPLVVAISAVLQRVRGHGVDRYLIKFFGLKNDSAAAISAQFGASAMSISTGALVLAVITSVVFSTGLGAVQQRAFELMWSLEPRKGVRSYLRTLAWAAALTAYVIMLQVVTRWGRDLGHLYGANVLTSNVFEGVLTAAFYWVSQFWLLAGRVRWRLLLPGAVAVGVATAALVRLSREILPGQISWQVHAYGPIGGPLVLSVWLMVLSTLIFASTLLGALWARRRVEGMSHAA